MTSLVCHTLTSCCLELRFWGTGGGGAIMASYSRCMYFRSALLESHTCRHHHEDCCCCSTCSTIMQLLALVSCLLQSPASLGPAQTVPWHWPAAS